MNASASWRIYFCFMGCSARASSLFAPNKTETRPSMTAWHSYSGRREGDSNPRYGYPYGSLANCWFKPLTHRSIQLKARCLKEIFPPTGGCHKPLNPRSSCFSSGTKIYNRCILYKYLPFFSGRGPCRKKRPKTETFHPLIMIGENNFIIFDDANPTGYVEAI